MSLQIENKIELDFENAFCDNGLKFKDINIDDENKKYKIVKRINKKGEIVEYKYEDVYNSESQKLRSKKFYENHKEEINQKINCDVCNKEISKYNIYKHNKSKKHIKNSN
jgi:hypothetical protein